MIIALALSLALTGFILWLLFTFAVYALPFYAGLSAAFFAYAHDAGLLGAAIVGLVSAGLVFGIGQVLLASVRTPLLRVTIGAVYAVPSGIAGYYAVYGATGIAGTGEAWRVGFALIGAIVIAGVAWVRLSAFAPATAGRGAPTEVIPSQPAMLGSANDR